MPTGAVAPLENGSLFSLGITCILHIYSNRSMKVQDV